MGPTGGDHGLSHSRHQRPGELLRLFLPLAQVALGGHVCRLLFTPKLRSLNFPTSIQSVSCWLVLLSSSSLFRCSVTSLPTATTFPFSGAGGQGALSRLSAEESHVDSIPDSRAHGSQPASSGVPSHLWVFLPPVPATTSWEGTFGVAVNSGFLPSARRQKEKKKQSVSSSRSRPFAESFYPSDRCPPPPSPSAASCCRTGSSAHGR